MTFWGDIRLALEILAACGAVAGCVYLLAGAVLVLRYRGRRSAQQGAPPAAVTVLVPLCGDEAGLSARLIRLRRQKHGAPVQILCGVSEAGDPALQSVREAQAADAPWPIEIVIDGRVHGRNPKISNLINMYRRARNDVLVLVDSDIEVDPGYVSRVTAQLSDPAIGAATCLYTGKGGPLPARMAAADINLHFLPSVIVGIATGTARPCLGATIALSRTTLRRIGGFARFADHLWDDYAIGEAVRADGLEVAICDFAPTHVCTERTLGQMAARQLRAARTIRGINPAGYAGSILTHPAGFALVAVLLHAVWWNWALLALALGGRFALGCCVARRFGGERPTMPILLLQELTGFAVCLASYAGSTVEWRGRRYRVGAGGTLNPA
jgi:ceramide glucosyltransferase